MLRIIPGKVFFLGSLSILFESLTTVLKLRAMHFEYQPHRFGISWTVRRDHPPDAGGHFYLGSYRIRVQAAPNTLVIWVPTDIHGTSLQNLDPNDENPAFIQTGIAIVTPNRLPSAWSKFCETEMKYQDMLSNVIRDFAEMLEGEDGEEN